MSRKLCCHAVPGSAYPLVIPHDGDNSPARIASTQAVVAGNDQPLHVSFPPGSPVTTTAQIADPRGVAVDTIGAGHPRCTGRGELSVPTALIAVPDEDQGKRPAHRPRDLWLADSVRQPSQGAPARSYCPVILTTPGVWTPSSSVQTPRIRLSIASCGRNPASTQTVTLGAPRVASNRNQRCSRSPGTG